MEDKQTTVKKNIAKIVQTVKLQIFHRKRNTEKKERIESTNDYSSMIFSLSESSYFEVRDNSQTFKNDILVALGRASYIFHIGQPKFISFQYRGSANVPQL